MMSVEIILDCFHFNNLLEYVNLKNNNFAPLDTQVRIYLREEKNN